MGISTLTSSDQIQTITVIQPPKGWAALNLNELWKYRELLFFLAQRDISVRYKQTILGATWAIIQPLLTMVIFSVIFGSLVKIPSDGIPYPIFSFVALLPWQYFATATSNASDSLVGNANLLSKVYFPRLLIPLAAVIPALADFAVAFVILIVLMLIYGIIPTWNIVWLPLFLLLALLTALGVALWLSAMNVQYRDIRYAVPFLVQIWMYLSPVVYSSSLVPADLRAIYWLNPMAGVIEGFRWALLGSRMAPALNCTTCLTGSGVFNLWGNGQTGPSLWMLALSASVSIVILVSGAFYFRRMENTFADVV